MSGIDFLADTNILLYILEGRETVKPFISDNLAVSVITEIELLGWHKITASQSAIIQSLLDSCFIIELVPAVKEMAIKLKQSHKLKLPDAIIAATAIHLNVPLLTADKAMPRLKELNILLLQA